MAKTVYFIRHAKSSWADPGLRDFDRPLNKRGLRDAPFMAQRLYQLVGKMDKIITSPANRAKTTAYYFAKAFGIAEKEVLLKPEVYHAYSDTLVQVVKEFDDNWESVCLFGHNPGFTSVANLFSASFIDNVPTCGIVEIGGGFSSWKGFGDMSTKVLNIHYPKQYFH